MTRLKKPFAVVERGAVRVDGMVVTDKGDDVSLDAVAYGLNSRVEAIVREALAEALEEGAAAIENDKEYPQVIPTMGAGPDWFMRYGYMRGAKIIRYQASVIRSGLK